MKKQMTYAGKREIPYVAMAGSNEMEKGIFSLKNMETGEQKEVKLDKLIKLLS
jgi:histidyl-tRNA synthetase